MKKEELQANPVRVGDVIQVHLLFHEYTFWIVAQLFEWGVAAYRFENAKNGEAYIHASWHEFNVIGRAHWALNDDHEWKAVQP